ncbi:MAG: DUF1302 domain-containing protein [Betaproteobacteria bacterium HGW-Betaproteobacteria-12]|nr:MAG: DUF1302 domain-containing protein [Betaproteobacteria bacterium HGW-Betaproteobacteria-12]
MNIQKRSTGLVVSGVAAALAAAFSGQANAVDFEFGDGWTGSWQNSVSLGTAWRANNPDKDLYSAASGAHAGLSGGRAPNTVDEGNVNYKKGDQFTTQVKWFTELQVQKGSMGALIRAKAWYDYTLNHQDVHYGNQNNGYRNAPLSDRGFENLSRYDGVALLDAYVYNTWDIAGKPLQVRLGNQVVNWGESLFVQGLNQINPIDVPSFHKPGAQLKEVFLPVPIAYANQSLGDAGSLEFFYQLKYENSPLDLGCGSYWSVAVGNISRDPGACDNAITLVPGQSQNVATPLGAYVHTIDAKDPSNSGQFGLAYRFNVDALDTEFGIYGMRYHARTPNVSIVNLANGRAQNGMPFDVMWEYPEAIKAFGVSASTNILGWSVAGEVSTRRDVAVQIDGNDLLLSGLGAAGAIAPGVSIPFGPYGNGAVSSAGLNGGNGYLPGYERANIHQLQVNAVKAGNRLLGGDQFIFIAEAGFQWNNLSIGGANDLRYNRAFIFGPGSDARYGGNTCTSGLNTTAAGCDTDGYVTNFAWGYRAKLDVTYNDVFSGVSVTPSVFWSHDVKGNSADSQFLEDRMALGLGAKFSYQKKYTVDVGATFFNKDAKYDPLRDRGFYYVTLNAAF